MSSLEEQILRTAKEIIVKFIETGRVSPSGFPESFKMIYKAIDDTVKGKDIEVQPIQEKSETK